MTFAEFQATGRDVEDVEPFANDDVHRAGRVYADDLYIERTPDGRMMVILGSDGGITGTYNSFGGGTAVTKEVTLADLERQLYEYAYGPNISG